MYFSNSLRYLNDRNLCLKFDKFLAQQELKRESANYIKLETTFSCLRSRVATCRCCC